jgi:hypothetical protein
MLALFIVHSGVGLSILSFVVALHSVCQGSNGTDRNHSLPSIWFAFPFVFWTRFQESFSFLLGSLWKRI